MFFQDQSRFVGQYRVTEWPDNVFVPTSSSSLLSLMEYVHTYQRGNQGPPVVVHCM